MTITPLPNIDTPVISYGSGLGVGWHSHRIGKMKMRPAGPGNSGSLSFSVYANVRVPTGLPTWPRALSLMPDLSERVN